MTKDITARKRRLLAPEKEKKRARKLRKRFHRECFWSRPWGHMWKYSSRKKRCMICDKELYIYSDL